MGGVCSFTHTLLVRSEGDGAQLSLFMTLTSNDQLISIVIDGTDQKQGF